MSKIIQEFLLSQKFSVSMIKRFFIRIDLNISKSTNKNLNKAKTKLTLEQNDTLKLFILLYLFINLINSILSQNIETNQIPNISLKIIGIGYNNIFSSEKGNFFDKANYPEKVYINGIRQNQINFAYYFNETENIVDLIWNKTINNCNYMFNSCSNITEINLTMFDTSQVESMFRMFNGCSKLVSLNLSNFDTQKVTNLGDIFAGCSSLTSLDLSNFNTSNATNLAGMFYNCTSLISLNLSNFDT